MNTVNEIGPWEQPLEGDSSKNVWWLGPLQSTPCSGDWHKNHYQNAGSARIGLCWWQADIGRHVICALEAQVLRGG